MGLIKNKITKHYSIPGIVLNVVIIFNLFSNSFHEFKEHKHSYEEVCNPEFEKDACHRYLIHHEESSACNKEHKHINEKSEDCFSCKYFKERQNGLNTINEQLLYVVFESSTHDSSSSSDINSISVFYTYLRGPPNYICNLI